MKAVLHLAGRSTDLSALALRFPDVSFVETRSLADYAREIEEAEILVAWSSDYDAAIAEATRRARRLKWIQFATSGIDGALKRGGFPPGLVTTNVAGLRAQNLAEHAFLLLLFLARNMRRFEAARGRREWARPDAAGRMTSLRGATALIVGMGAIGQAIAERVQAFEMKAIAVSRSYRPGGAVERVFSRGEARAAFALADAVFVCLPSEPATRGFVDQEKLAAMKPSAFLINVSRGDILAEDDLIEACRSGRIAGAGLDVAATEPPPSDSPLWTLENVVLTPHVGGAGSDESDRLAEMIAENIELYLAGAPLVRQVLVT